MPDGTYRAVVKLERSHRTIVLPSDITVDTTPPRIIARPATKYPIISPDGDGHADVFRIPYEVSEPAHAILLLRGKQVVFTNGQKEKGTLVWNGKVPAARRGRFRPAGTCSKIAARDRAGNRSTGVPFAIAQVRYVTLAPHARRRSPGRPVRAARVDRRAAGRLAATRPLGNAPARDAPSARAEDGGRLPPVRLGREPLRRLRGGGRMSGGSRHRSRAPSGRSGSRR